MRACTTRYAHAKKRAGTDKSPRALVFASSLLLLAWCGARLSGRRSIRRIVVEISIFNGHDIGGFELILVVLVVVEADDASLSADTFERLLRLQDLVGAGLTLHDRDLVISIVPVGERGSVGTERTKCCPHQHDHGASADGNSTFRGWRQGCISQRYFFFAFAAGFLAALAAGFFAAAFLAAMVHLPDVATDSPVGQGEIKNFGMLLQTHFSADGYRRFR